MARFIAIGLDFYLSSRDASLPYNDMHVMISIARLAMAERISLYHAPLHFRLARIGQDATLGAYHSSMTILASIKPPFAVLSERALDINTAYRRGHADYDKTYMRTKRDEHTDVNMSVCARAHLFVYVNIA